MVQSGGSYNSWLTQKKLHVQTKLLEDDEELDEKVAAQSLKERSDTNGEEISMQCSSASSSGDSAGEDMDSDFTQFQLDETIGVASVV